MTHAAWGAITAGGNLYYSQDARDSVMHVRSANQDLDDSFLLRVFLHLVVRLFPGPEEKKNTNVRKMPVSATRFGGKWSECAIFPCSDGFMSDSCNGHRLLLSAALIHQPAARGSAGQPATARGPHRSHPIACHRGADHSGGGREAGPVHNNMTYYLPSLS